jgi:hypothetical protein
MAAEHKKGYRSVEITKETYNDLMQIGQYNQSIDAVIRRLLDAFKDIKRSRSNKSTTQGLHLYQLVKPLRMLTQ